MHEEPENKNCSQQVNDACADIVQSIWTSGSEFVRQQLLVRGKYPDLKDFLEWSIQKKEGKTFKYDGISI